MNSFFDLFKSPSKNTKTGLSSSMDSITEPKSNMSSPSLNSSTSSLSSPSLNSSPSLSSSTDGAFIMRTTSSPSIDIPNRESSYFRMLQVVEAGSF
ncbi:hypothetical protein DDB_G0278807 [Dictyostelium discoideum AX4]|uniref:Uncharacterized protein n=1 Tax=Dictyostelium discoideum TaxID=44689 RepID=Q54XQ4_DICDI|nr:hypothetical protein DDB_G0278807 [Dictyostelium discoideum AX4]EAL68005.1 hypothetical protein DDB_G0278807 [Dictyostelium discoideum AX4]|eukprot:XP_641976.1 hypothetical protein DDB_G0278807 [Dictyostelium discoideum AX4]